MIQVNNLRSSKIALMELQVYVSLLILTCSIETISSQMTLVSGDIYIEGIFTLYDDNSGRSLPSSIQHLEAVRWTIDQLNDGNYVPDMKIGLKIHPTNGNDDQALDIAYNISRRLGGADKDTLAIIGPERNSETELVSRLLSALPEELRVLQVSYSADKDALNDKDVFPNFHRVIPPRIVGTQVIGKFLSEMYWTYVAVFHDNTTQSIERTDDLKQYVQGNGKITCIPRVVQVMGSNVELIQSELQDMFEGNIQISGALVFGGQTLVKDFFTALKKLRADTTLNYIVPSILLAEDEAFSLTITADNLNETKGIYLVSPAMTMVESFKEHWNYVIDNNHTSSSYVQKLIDENIQPEVMSKQSVYVDYAIKATIAIADSFKQMHQKHCVTENNKLACMTSAPKAKFINILEGISINLGNINILPASSQDYMSFSPDSPDVQLEYELSTRPYFDYAVYNHQAVQPDSTVFVFEKVFEMSSNDRISIEHPNKIRDYYEDGTERIYPDVRKPQCPDGNICPGCPVQDMAEMNVTKGDMYIVGIVPIHTTSVDPLTCGSVKQGGYDVAEAIQYAVQDARERYESKIPNGKIGVIIVDSCNDAQIISARILQLLNKGIFEDGKFIEVKSKILGFVGGWVSDNSIAVATILSKTGYVQISYGSTSPVLSDRSRFPYFMRMIPNDLVQGENMIEIVKRLGSDFVQILYSKTAYGTGGKDSLLQHAKKHHICVSKVTGVEQSDVIDKRAIIASLRKPNQPKIIMVYLSSFDVVKMIDELKTMKDYVFVASEAWGNRDILKDAENLKGSITLANELPIQQVLPGFNEHFETISKQEETGTWLTEYYEDYFDCYHEWSFDKSERPNKCNRKTQFFESRDCYNPSEESTCFKIETWVPFAAIGIQTLLRGARKTLDELCGNSFQICSNYLDNPRKLVDNVASIKVAYNGLQEKNVFDDNRDGLIDLNTYLIKTEGGDTFYHELEGQWEDEYTYNLSTCDLIKHGVCESESCFKDTSQETVDGNEERVNGERVAMIVFIVIAIILTLAIVVIIIIWRKQLLCCAKKVGYSGNYADGYISPINDGYLSTCDVRRDIDNTTEMTMSDSSTRENTCSDDTSIPSEEPHSGFNKYI